MLPSIGAVDFAIDNIPRATLARTGGITALRHEATDHAVEERGVVKALFYQADKIGDGVGCFVLKKLDHNLAF